MPHWNISARSFRHDKTGKHGDRKRTPPNLKRELSGKLPSDRFPPRHFVFAMRLAAGRKRFHEGGERRAFSGVAACPGPSLDLSFSPSGNAMRRRNI